jgi:DNA polymerase V
MFRNAHADVSDTELIDQVQKRTDRDLLGLDWGGLRPGLTGR